jgi:hypothetical protein
MGLVILGSWQRESGNIAGMKRALGLVVEGCRTFCLVFFQNEHTLRTAIQFLKFVS